MFCWFMLITYRSSSHLAETFIHQTFQVPKMEGFLGGGFPLHTAYIGEYPHFRYLKSLVIYNIPQNVGIDK